MVSNCFGHFSTQTPYRFISDGSFDWSRRLGHKLTYEWMAPIVITSSLLNRTLGLARSQLPSTCLKSFSRSGKNTYRFSCRCIMWIQLSSCQSLRHKVKPTTCPSMDPIHRIVHSGHDHVTGHEHRPHPAAFQSNTQPTLAMHTGGALKFYWCLHNSPVLQTCKNRDRPQHKDQKHRQALSESCTVQTHKQLTILLLQNGHLWPAWRCLTEQIARISIRMMSRHGMHIIRIYNYVYIYIYILLILMYVQKYIYIYVYIIVYIYISIMYIFKSISQVPLGRYAHSWLTH